VKNQDKGAEHHPQKVNGQCLFMRLKPMAVYRHQLGGKDVLGIQEMSVSTGGADAKSATGGIQLNMMLKSGTNNYHGNAKGYFENESLQLDQHGPRLGEEPRQQDRERRPDRPVHGLGR
jgi:hypothetical protein